MTVDPLYGRYANPVGDKKLVIEYEPDTDLRDTEQVPLQENVEAFLKREVLPYTPDAWIDDSMTKIGYEISFTPIHAVYVKTGNESPSRRPTADLCGVLMRSELLAILDRFTNVENQIVREFREHLHRIQADTESYRTLPPSQWKGRAVEGFYGAIAEWLSKLHTSGELRENPCPQWSYQSNPRGGERVCCWYWTDLAPGSYKMWLQLNDAATLHLRVANAEQGGVKPKVQPSQLNEVLQRLTLAAAVEPWIGRIRVRKAGRFGGGDSAAVAELTFDASGEDWLPLDAHNLLDWPETCRRLRLAMQFLDSLRYVREVQP